MKYDFLQMNRKLLRMISMMLSITILCVLWGCKDKSITSEPSGSEGSSYISSEENTSTSSEENIDTSSKNDVVTSFGGNSIAGVNQVNQSVERQRSDYKEVSTGVLNPNKYAPLKGYADKEADELRNKILNAKNTEHNYKITGTKYYISPGGDDKNDGKSPKTAFRTIDALNSINLKKGDAVLFERDSIFRFNRCLICVTGVIYGSYGEGAKPTFYAGPYNFADANYWEPTQMKNVWRTPYTYEALATIVFDAGELVGAMRYDVVDLKENGDFYNDETSVYVYCDKGNPYKVYDSIEFSPDRSHLFCPEGIDNVVLDNLCMLYGSGGFTAHNFPENLYVTNCVLGYIGGSVWYDGKTRLGNALGVWDGGKNIHYDHNWIYQTFDTAISWQGDKCQLYEDITFNDNLLEYNSCDFEFFEPEGTVIRNFSMDNNIIRFSAAGWGTRANDDGIRGFLATVAATTYRASTIEKLTFRNNTIDCPVYRIFKFLNKPEDNVGFVFSGNKYYVKQSYRISDTIVAQFRQKIGDPATDYLAKNEKELKDSICAVDPTAEVYWFE